MNIYLQIRKSIISIVSRIFNIEESILSRVAIETPKNKSFGDLSTNVAMVLAKILKMPPIEIAEKIKSEMSVLDYIDSINISANFINFRLVNKQWHKILKEILSKGYQYGYEDIGKNTKVNVEYVSANPTGPLHIGHTRGAILGDVISKMLKIFGFDVTKEYYINDAGKQVDNLVQSVYARYLEIATGEAPNFTDDMYKGEYVVLISKNLYQKYNENLINNLDQYYEEIKTITIDNIMDIVRSDLKELGIKHDVFFSESILYKNNAMKDMIDFLKRKSMVYYGTPPLPKGYDKKSKPEQHLMFRSTKYGDDQDRVVQKSNGEYTYFAPDLAYMYNKYNRGYKDIIMVLGNDHIGYVKRLQAAAQTIDSEKISCDIMTYELVNYVKNNQQVKMSKRSGNFTTAKQVVDLVGKDAVRFMMISSKNTSVIDFDLDKVVEHTKDNPVFYIKYANVRICSVMQLFQDKFPKEYKKYSKIFDCILNNISKTVELKTPQNLDVSMLLDINLSNLDLPQELNLIKVLSFWPQLLRTAVENKEPHKISFYLQEVASTFHALWSFTQTDSKPYRIVVQDNLDLTVSRILLSLAVATILKSGANILDIDLPTKM